MISQEQVYDFVCLMDDTGRMYSCEDGFCFYLLLDDEWLEKIKTNPELLIEPNIMKDLLIQTGKNVHFIGAYGKGFKVIRDAIKNIEEDKEPKSISWFNRDMSKFTFRRLECRQL